MKYWRIAILFLLAFSSVDCARLGKKVAAYDRQVLSQTGMQFIENAVEESSMQHMFNSREGSVGGFGGAGGGCGCN